MDDGIINIEMIIIERKWNIMKKENQENMKNQEEL